MKSSKSNEKNHGKTIIIYYYILALYICYIFFNLCVVLAVLAMLIGIGSQLLINSLSSAKEHA